MIEHSQDTQVDLRSYLRVLRRRKVIILLTTLVVLGLAIGVAMLQDPTYEADAQVLVTPRAGEAAIAEGEAVQVDRQRTMQNEVLFVRSDAVRAAATKELGGPASIDVSTVEEADVITLTAESGDPARAAEIADAYATAYIDVRKQRQVDDLVETVEVLQNKIRELRRQRAELGPSEMSQVAALDESISNLSTTLQTLQVRGQVTEQGDAQIIHAATVPDTPASPNVQQNALIGLVLGLVLGFGFAFLAEHFDDSVRTKEDLQAAIGGMPVLGLIPRVTDWRKRSAARVIAAERPSSAAAEAYRTLRTSVRFLGIDRPLRTIAVTSPNASEGKSTTVANLAIALANAGQRVIVVCCDLRRPRLHEFFGLDKDVGFTSVLLGERTLTEALQDVDAQPRLQVLASGPLPSNPSELLSLRRTGELIDQLSTMADVVLIDGPPLIPVADSLVLARMVDGVMLVTSSRDTSKREARRAVELLAQVEAPVIGCVLNGVPTDGRYGYQYGRYGYESAYAPPKSPTRRGRRRKSPPVLEDAELERVLSEDAR